MSNQLQAEHYKRGRQRIFDAITEPKFRDQLEQKYTVLFAQDCEFHNAWFWFHMSGFYWALLPIVGSLVGFDTLLQSSLLMIAPLFVCFSYMIVKLVRNLKTLRYMQLVGYLACNVAMCFLCRVDIQDGVGERVLAGLWIIGSAMGVVVLAFRSHMHGIMLAAVSTMFFFGFKDYPGHKLGVLLGVGLVFLGSFLQVVWHRLFKVEAINSFRQQSRFTPKQIILNAVTAGMPVTEVFKPSLRFCACICSDWRNFQAWTSETSSERMASTLTKYYEHMVRELDTLFPKGNYFIDWIADELFVVAFASEEFEYEQIVTGAVRFGRFCIDSRESFADKYGVPEGLDVGVSVGFATVGTLGPPGNMKATALGNAPGTARRLQMAAKAARHFLGDYDRLFVDAEVSKFVDVNRLGMEKTELPKGLTVKDLAAKSLYAYTTAACKAIPDVENEGDIRILETPYARKHLVG